MRMYLPFGDWSCDGHSQSDKILIEVPSSLTLRDAQDRIREKYGRNFFQGMAQEYQEPYFSKEVWQAMFDTNYPVERFIKFEENDNWEGIENLYEVGSDAPLSILLVMDVFIWIMNAFGAEIEKVEDQEPIPNAGCYIETVGYGCYE